MQDAWEDKAVQLGSDDATIAAYLGCDGGRRWARLEQQRKLSSAEPDAPHDAITDAVVGLLKDRPFSRYVALGPGLGLFDKTIIQSLRRSFNFDYVGVDISHYLITQSQKAVASTGVRVHADILGNFESASEFLHICEICKPELGIACYTMLGNTFTNLSRGEETFLRRWLKATNKGDLLLIEVRAISEEWNADQDPWKAPQSWNGASQVDAAKLSFLYGALRCTDGVDISEEDFFAQYSSMLESRPAVIGSSLSGIAWELIWKNPELRLLRTVRYDATRLESGFSPTGVRTMNGMVLRLVDRHLGPAHGTTRLRDYILLFENGGKA